MGVFLWMSGTIGMLLSKVRVAPVFGLRNGQQSTLQLFPPALLLHHTHLQTQLPVLQQHLSISFPQLDVLVGRSDGLMDGIADFHHLLLVLFNLLYQHCVGDVSRFQLAFQRVFQLN